MSAQFMVETQIKPRGVSDPMVLEAMAQVNRDDFVPEDYKHLAYADCPLPIPNGQTISQPYMVAAMTEYLGINHESKVLEIGTGCGYQTAILARIAKQVYTVEIIPNLAKQAKQRLQNLGYRNIHFKNGDGHFGWQEWQPYDAVMVTAAPRMVPTALEAQLRPGGRMVIPVGPNADHQNLHLMTKGEDGTMKSQAVMAVRFVPLTGGQAQ